MVLFTICFSIPSILVFVVFTQIFTFFFINHEGFLCLWLHVLLAKTLFNMDNKKIKNIDDKILMIESNNKKKIYSVKIQDL